MSRSRVAVVLMGVIVLLVSCPNPFDVVLSRQGTDRSAPVIAVTSPLDGSTYEPAVTITGTVSDGADGKVAGLTLSVPVAEISAALEVGDDGAFSSSFSTAGISRAIVITLQATDWNGNVAEKVITLFNDDAGPGIAILSPEDASTYLSTVEVEGLIQSMSSLQALTVAVQAAGIIEPQVLEPEEDGTFTFSFSTQDISSTILAVFTATDPNGNASVATLTLYNDGVGPFAEITEPEDMSYYSSVVLVSGTVLDAENLTSIGEVESVSYSVPGTSVSGDLTLGIDGSYTFTFQTKDSEGIQIIDGPRTIEVTATDWNGNATTVTVTILRADNDNDFASFTITPSNKAVTIEWDSVLYATSYTLYNPRYGKARENVTSPYIWDELNNGKLYTFQLQAVIPDEIGADAWSDLRDAIPLSQRTLAPLLIDAGYRSITIEWPAIAAADEYVVERAVGDGPWLMRGLTSGTTLTDSEVCHGTWYSYRVSPVEQIGIRSASVGASPHRFPAGRAAQVGAVDTSGTAWGVCVAAGYAYVADYEDGLRIIDISDLTSPALAGTYNTTGNALNVAVSGSYAYVADDLAGLAIINVSDPAHPTLAYTYDSGETPRVKDVVVSGSYAYLAVRERGLVILNVTDPTSPTEAGSAGTGNLSTGIAFSGSYAYVSEAFVGLRVYSVANPASPAAVGSADTGGASDVAVSGSYAYLGSSDGVTAVDVSDPLLPVEEDTLATTQCRGIAVVGDTAYAADADSGLRIISLATPETPALVATFATSGSSCGVFVADDLVYLADGLTGLHIVDVKAPRSATLVTTRDTDGSACDVVLAAGRAYVADGGSKELRVFEIAANGSISPAERWPTDGSANAVAVSGRHAYVADYPIGLTIIDLVPTTGGKVGSYDLGSKVYDVAVSGDYAYVAADALGLAILDVSDPTAPASIGYYDTDGIAQGVAIMGDYAYVADGSNGLVIVDISAPGSPSLAGESAGFTGTAVSVAVHGIYAYVAKGSTGFEIFDVSSPASPVAVPGSAVDTDGTASAVAVGTSYAYVADGSVGLKVFDVRVPGAPVLLASRDTMDALGVAVGGSYAFVADGTAGLRVIRLGE